MAAKLFETKYKIILPSGLVEHCSVQWPKEPDYPTIRDLVEPIVGEPMEHVTVLNPGFCGTAAQISGSDARDMFVNENAYLQTFRPPVNRMATAIYLRLTHIRGQDYYHEILGTAVLFDRRIWF